MHPRKQTLAETQARLIASLTAQLNETEAENARLHEQVADLHEQLREEKKHADWIADTHDDITEALQAVIRKL